MAIATLTKNQHARTNVIPKYITMTTGVDKELTSPCNTKKRSALLPASGAWMYAFPFHLADLVSCGKPPPVLNAQDWYQFTSIGTNVTYVCDPGYTLFGSTRRTCKANGKWDGVKPYCCTFWSKYFSQSIIFFLSLIILPIWHLDLDQKVAITTFGVYCALKVESFSGITSLEWEKKTQTFSPWSCQAKGQIILLLSPFSLRSPHAFYKRRNRLHGDLGRGPFICSAARLLAKQAPKLLIISTYLF